MVHGVFQLPFARVRKKVQICALGRKIVYQTQSVTNYYLGVDEVSPKITARNKHFIPRVMFLVAIARPRYDRDENLLLMENLAYGRL